MPSDMLTSLFSKLMAETGLVGALLFVACIYLAREWSKERKAHTTTIERLWDLSEKSTTSSIVSSEATKQMHGVVERLIAQRGGSH